MTSREFNTVERHSTSLQKENRRTFKDADETQRKIEQGDIKVKNHQYYSKMTKGMVSDNIWNETSKLSPDLSIYSHENIDPKKTFKKMIRDLPKVAQQEREEKFQQSFNQILKGKQDGFERYSARKLERFITQYQCSQGLTDEQIEQIQKIERDDP